MAHDKSCHCGSSTALGEDPAPVRPEHTVADIVHRRASALEIMKQLGINHCCGAHLTLAEAAAAAGVPLDTLLAALDEPRKASA